MTRDCAARWRCHPPDPCHPAGPGRGQRGPRRPGHHRPHRARCDRPALAAGGDRTRSGTHRPGVWADRRRAGPARDVDRQQPGCCSAGERADRHRRGRWHRALGGAAGGPALAHRAALREPRRGQRAAVPAARRRPHRRVGAAVGDSQPHQREPGAGDLLRRVRAAVRVPRLGELLRHREGGAGS